MSSKTESTISNRGDSERMRAFSELAPGDHFFWQGKTCQKIKPTANPIPHKDPVNAVQISDPPVFTTIPGWCVVIEPSDIAELTPKPTDPAILHAEIEQLKHEVDAAERAQKICYTCGQEITAMAQAVTP